MLTPCAKDVLHASDCSPEDLPYEFTACVKNRQVRNHHNFETSVKCQQGHKPAGMFFFSDKITSHLQRNAHAYGVSE